MGILREVNGYLRMTLNKLDGIRGDLVRTDDDWQEWKFHQLVEALRKWTVRNPLKPDEDTDREKPPSWQQQFKPLPKFPKSRDRMFNSRRDEWKTRPCVNCESREHIISRLWQGIGRGTTGKVPQWEKVVFQLHWYKAPGCRVSYR